MTMTSEATTMTTERRPPNRAAPHLRVSSLELRLYVAALFAVVYTISWRVIGGHAAATEPAIAAVPTTHEPRPVVWIDDLPSSMRPAVVLPAGWELASEPQTSATPPARIVRVPARRVPRVRTRSS
jgi:hypothetical protein